MLKDDVAFAVHLSFNGNCGEAFRYYQTCFGGELTVQTLADTPFAAGIGKGMLKTVVWATLKNGYFKLVGTDLTDEGSLVSGNNVGLLIECHSYTERIKLINKLICRNYCSVTNRNPIINVIDRYSVRWIISVNPEAD